MDTKQMLITMEMKAKLSSLWIFMLFNVLFRDIHDFFRPGLIEEMMTGIVNGTQITEELMLIAGITLQIPIAMIVLSRVLKYRFNRPANIIAGAITITFFLGNAPKDLDDIWFLVIGITTLLFIMWTAWRWRKVEARLSPSVS